MKRLALLTAVAIAAVVFVYPAVAATGNYWQQRATVYRTNAVRQHTLHKLYEAKWRRAGNALKDERARAARLERDLAKLKRSYLVPLGSYRLTGYCASCNTPRGSRQTSSGRLATVGVTCARPAGFPAGLGSWVYIEGIGARRIDDSCGTSALDIYVGRHGTETSGRAKVYLIKDRL